MTQHMPPDDLSLWRRLFGLPRAEKHDGEPSEPSFLIMEPSLSENDGSFLSCLRLTI